MSKALDNCRRHGVRQLCRASGRAKLHSTALKHDKRVVAIDTRTSNPIGFNSRISAPGQGWKIAQPTRYNSAMAVGEP